MQGTYHGDENENLHTLMIYQSMSGDADEGEANMTINGGSVTGLNGDLIYSTNTTSVLSLNNVALTLSNGTLLRVCGNDGARGRGTVGKNGEDMKFNATNQILTGNIIVDEISSLIFTISENSSFEGAINTAQECIRTPVFIFHLHLILTNDILLAMICDSISLYETTNLKSF